MQGLLLLQEKAPTVITPAARDHLPLNCGQSLKQKTAVPFYCHNPYDAVVKSEKSHWFSLGTRQHLYLLRDQAEGYGFPRSLQTALLTLQCNCLWCRKYSWCACQCQVQGGQLTFACLCALTLCCWAYRNVIFTGMDLLGGPKLTETLGSVSGVSYCLI